MITGLAGGLAVGGSIVAFFTVLGVVTRIIEYSGTKGYTKYYEICIMLGGVGGTLVYFFDFNLSVPRWTAVPLGLVMGIFVGMIAAALTETLDIISTAATTLNIVKWIYGLIIIIILGKMIGSALYWIVPGFF